MLSLFLLLSVPHSATSDFMLPAGFSIVEVAGPELANDIYCLAISPEGHVVVSGRGYLKQLVEDHHDGIYHRAITLADHPRDGAMGLCFADGFLYFMGDGGLRRIAWKPGSFTANSELLLKLKTGGEHDAHAISKGPDGYFYLLCGNMAGIKPEQATLPGKTKKPHVAGGVLRVAPDFQTSELICDGFRNAYGFDWSLHGELYTWDSDNERCMGLPWYEGCRFYRIEKGGHYGWRSPQLGQFWRLPPYYPGVVEPLLDLGRGSPTGVVCYRQQQFPLEYQGNFFLCDWTFGVIHRVMVLGNQAETKVFLKVTPGHGFAPTAACVHPQTGDLYVSTGGRGTRGAVYRIRHEEGFKALPPGATQSLPPLAVTSKTLHARDSNVVLRLSPFDTLLRLQVQGGELHANSTEYAFKEGYEYRAGKPNPVQKLAREQLLKMARKDYPHNASIMNHELARSFALLRESEPATVTKMLQQITGTSSPIEDTHILFALACCPAPRNVEQRKLLADALVHLEYKYQKMQLTRERHWELRLAEAVKAHLDIDPELAQSLLDHPGFRLPQQLNYLADARLPREKLATIYQRELLAHPDLEWSSKMVEIVSHEASAQTLTLIRQKWDDPALREAIVPVLAKHAAEVDRPLFHLALRQLSREAAQRALDALRALPQPEGNAVFEECAALLQAIKTWHSSAPELSKLLRERLLIMASSNSEPVASTPAQLEQWLLAKYPDIKKLLATSEGIDLETWLQQNPNLPWQAARLEEGEKQFKKLCAACHQGSGALGPDLTGIGKRFNRNDLLTAILQPSKDVSARYRTSIFVSEDGLTHTGLVIYEAIDGVILQTGASNTIRLSGKQIAARRTSDKSLMPAGLLDKLSSQEIADLIGYLQR